MALFRSARIPEARGANWLAFQDIVEANRTAAGVPVSQETATQLPAVYRCVSLNADTVSSMPVDVMVRRGDTRMPYPEPRWMREPNAEQDWGQFVHQAQTSLELDGNAFLLKSAQGNGAIDNLYVLAPSAVTVERDRKTSRIVYKVQTDEGQSAVLADTEVLHIRWVALPGQLRGLSPIAAARQTIGTAVAAEQFASQFFGTGATLSGVVTVPGSMDPENVERLREAFKRKHGGLSKSHAIGILTGGAQWVPLSVNPEESQFLETRRFNDIQIAHMFGVPPMYVTEAEGAKGYVSGIYAMQWMWLQTGMNPRLVRLERALSSLLARPAYVKFNRNAFLAMDPQDRVSYYSAGLRDQWLVPNEVRSLEDMNPIEGGDEPLQSVQYQEEGPQPAEEVPQE